MTVGVCHGRAKATPRFSRSSAPDRYLNYIDHDDTAADATLAAVYGPNLDRLRTVKGKYDPQNVFHHNVNITPS